MKETTKIHTLVAAAQSGDDQAFALLYEAYYTPVFRYIISRVGDHAEAEDCAQNVFLKFFETLSSFTVLNEKQTWSYLFTMARNHIINRGKKAQRVVADTEKTEIILENLAGRDEYEPQNVFHRKSQKTEVLSVLKNIPEKYRMILQLKFFEDLSNKEIAERLSLTEPNVRQLQVRALRKLHKYFTLQSYYDE